MKTIIILITLIIATITISCEKDITLDLDITEFEWEWELKSITANAKEHKKPSREFHHPEAYILIFENDTIFWLNLSSNSGGGKYKIPNKGNIEIEPYSILTEIEMTEFDEKVLNVFKKMTSYTVKCNTLAFTGNNSEVEFKKKIRKNLKPCTKK